jgi:hypothetical protein
MKKIVRLTESDLMRIVKRVINEQSEPRKGDYISLKCINPYNNSGKVIEPVEFSEYLDNSEPLPDKLVVQRPSGIPSDEVFSSGGDNDTYTLSVTLIEDPDLKQDLGITTENGYMLTYNVGGKFYCSSKKTLSPSWTSFFKEKNITV